jgi:maltose O-acetyltransferase
MSAGLTPLTPEQLDVHPLGYAVGMLPDDGRRAWAWLLRGHPATSFFLPTAVRRGLLRLGGVRIGACVFGIEKCWFQTPNVTLGDGVGVGYDVWFEGRGKIHVGADTLLSSYSIFLTSNHPISPDGEVSRSAEYRDMWIGERCYLGARVTVMPGVRIGHGVVIGTGSVVTKDCEAGGLYVGVPAKRIR